MGGQLPNPCGEQHNDPFCEGTKERGGETEGGAYLALHLVSYLLQGQKMGIEDLHCVGRVLDDNIFSRICAKMMRAETL